MAITFDDLPAHGALPPGETRVAGIASVQEGSRAQGEWITARRLNGNQDNQGRSVFLPDHQFKLLRVKLYTIPSR